MGKFHGAQYFPRAYTFQPHSFPILQKQRKVEASRSDGAADSAVVLFLPTTRSRRVSVVNAAMVDHDDSQLSFYSCHSCNTSGVLT